jgi:signal transduction histidine kinase
MRERAALVGGEIELESDPVRGPSVRLRVPLPQGTPE